ncbi:hypothetical protein EDF56_103557 [Novosphingobium sp. PhB165]|nr:hypothetical protein [Novosphingobium sp. PhB165]TCM19912.1 hypothetical protein EDF56_103557 [Novosphingobium sp. PhB165]
MHLRPLADTLARSLDLHADRLRPAAQVHVPACNHASKGFRP